MFDIGEREKYEEQLGKWKEHEGEESNSLSKPHEPIKELIYVYCGEQRFYLLPIVKMHGIYGFVKFDTPPKEWTVPEDECVFIVNDKAQNKLGVIYWNGEVTGKNMDRAAYWLRRASEQRHPQSLTLLGIYHYIKRSNPLCAKLVFQALNEASKYYEFSSYYYLGHCYEYGIGTSVNLEYAVWNYKLAIAAGITRAESDLRRVRAKSE